MSCDDRTPWTIAEHPYTINRLRVTAGGSTDQSSGEWIAETTSSMAVCGQRGQVGYKSSSITIEMLETLGGGTFKKGDQYFVCNSDCDIILNDLIEMYEDEDGTEKTYWRVMKNLKSLTVYKNIRGAGMNYWLVRLEER